MKHVASSIASALAILAMLVAPSLTAQDGDWTLVGWNDLGMHCMDADFEVFSILPPYNTIHAQLVDSSGNLVTNATGITVTYEAVADPDGSINTTSVGKTNFWDHVLALFGAPLAPDQGLAGHDMPGAGNTPQPMVFDDGFSWFTGEGIPITPYDDDDVKNYYPMMRLVARDSGGSVLATTEIVLPVSDEMSCRSCHGSGSGPDAEPSGGWIYDPDPERDYRLNVLLLHDDYQGGSPLYVQALTDAGYNPLGLYLTATGDGTPVLCAACHGSNALPGTGQLGIPPLTEAVHALHAGVIDPATGMSLDDSDNRAACYTCHPGSETRCLRGAMGNSVASDGSLPMQCQSCHGGMAVVGAAGRPGWFDEPTCQNCHTGTAIQNNGQIRYTDVYDGGSRRVAVNNTFATNPDTPLPGFSLYRFSVGHGGLQCEACHGSTHAIYPSSHLNDNIQNLNLQGHEGTLADCDACHGDMPSTVDGGPHGMHPVGEDWVDGHEDAAEDNPGQCRACHGADYRGTVLSRSLGNRLLRTEFGDKDFWRGFQIGCYTCHNGPRDDDENPNRAPVVLDLTAFTAQGDPVEIPLAATDPDGDELQLRVVTQSYGGTVGVIGSVATYYPSPSFVGSDRFTYAAWDGSTDSNLAEVGITVGTAGCIVSCSASVPSSGAPGSPVDFQASATTQGCAGEASYSWDFGDGSPAGSGQSTSHSYALPGTYTWSLVVTVDGVTCTRTGSITIEEGPDCDLRCSAEASSRVRVGREAEFHGEAEASDCSGHPEIWWDFGDGSPAAQGGEVRHAYGAPGSYTWTMRAVLGGAVCERSGVIVVTGRGDQLGRFEP